MTENSFDMTSSFQEGHDTSTFSTVDTAHQIKSLPGGRQFSWDLKEIERAWDQGEQDAAGGDKESPTLPLDEVPNDSSIVQEQSENFKSFQIRNAWKEETENRGRWLGRVDFVAFMIGATLGSGNWLRFPYLMISYGGVAFLVPYILFLVLLGFPLMYLELNIGQFCSRGVIRCWHIAPLYRGIGIAAALSATSTIVVMVTKISLVLHYFIVSFWAPLPWSTCNNHWNTQDCRFKLPDTECVNGTRYSNGTCYEGTAFFGIWNYTVFQDSTQRKRISPAEEYWMNYIWNLDKNTAKSGLSKINFPMILSSLFIWTVLFLSYYKGVLGSKMVMYPNILFACLISFVLGLDIFKTAAVKDILWMFQPNFERLKDPNCWIEAGSQVLFSLNIGMGVTITMASYCTFTYNILKDVLMLIAVDVVGSLWGTIVIFGYVGQGVPRYTLELNHNVTKDANLLYVKLPNGMINSPNSSFISVMFFMATFQFRLCSLLALVGTPFVSITEASAKLNRYFVRLSICVICFFLSVPFSMKAGFEWMDNIFSHIISCHVSIIVLFELFVVTSVYGLKNFLDDISAMTGDFPNRFWNVSWYFTCPATVGSLLIMTWNSIAVSGMYYIFALGLVPLFIITGDICFQLFVIHKDKTFREKLQLLKDPNYTSGPVELRCRNTSEEEAGLIAESVKENVRSASTATGYSSGTYQQHRIKPTHNSQEISRGSHLKPILEPVEEVTSI